MIKFLKGKKTFFTALAIGVVAFLKKMGYDIPEGTLEMLGALAVAFLRAGVKKGEVNEKD